MRNSILISNIVKILSEEFKPTAKSHTGNLKGIADKFGLSLKFGDYELVGAVQVGSVWTFSVKNVKTKAVEKLSLSKAKSRLDG
jgi:hypothetical protein